MKISIITFFLGFIFAAFNAFADVKSYVKSNSYVVEEENSKFYPYVYFDSKIEGFYDKLKSDANGANNFFYTFSYLTIDTRFNKVLGIHTNFSLEPIKGTNFNPSSIDGAFKSESPFYGTSLLTKELSVFFEFQRVKMYLGKIQPRFGAGSERTSDYFYDSWYGISGTLLNQGYQLDEKLGFLVDIELFSRENAKVALQAAFFTNDATELYKKPFFTERQINGFVVPIGNKRLAGDAKNLSSHAVSMQGFFGLSNRDVISFSLGYKKQFSKHDAAEQGYVGALQYTKTFLDDFNISTFGELGKISNSYAIEGYDERYITYSISGSAAGFVIGALQNRYKADYNNTTKKINLTEYFIGFEVPKTELGFFLSRKEYKVNGQSLDGFGVNIRYRIR